MTFVIDIFNSMLKSKENSRIVFSDGEESQLN